MDNISKQDALLRVAKRIKELRLKKKVSQQDAYNDTSIHFGRIEQGKRDLSYFTLLRICNYLYISISFSTVKNCLKPWDTVSCLDSSAAYGSASDITSDSIGTPV